MAAVGKFRRKAWRIVLFGAILFAVALGLFHLEEDWRARRAWEAYKRQEIARGDSFDPKRLIPPAVPDDQNFAMTPFLAPLSHASNQTAVLVNTSNAWQVEAIGSVLPRSVGLNLNFSWAPGVAHELRSWAMAFQEADLPPTRGVRGRYRASFQNGEISRTTVQVPKSETAAAPIVLDHLKPFEAIRRELQVAKTRSYCRFAVDYDGLSSGSWSHLTALYNLSQILALHTSAEMALGQNGPAYEDMDLALYLCDAVKDEPLRPSFQSRQACLEFAVHTLATGLAAQCWSDSQLARLQTMLQGIDLLPDFIRAAYGERDLNVNKLFDEWKGSIIPAQSDPDEPPGEKLECAIIWAAIPHDWVRFEQLNYNRLFRRTVLPRIDLAHRVISPSINQKCDTEFYPYSPASSLWRVLIHHDLYAVFELQFYGRMAQKTAFTQNEITMSATACALERFRLAHTQYPAELRELVPGLLPKLPQDIINGQPLKYHGESGGSFVLYSVGWNEKDDGGVVAMQSEYPWSVLQDITKGDWVWKQPP